MAEAKKPEVGAADDELERVVRTARGKQSGTDGGEIGYGRPPMSGRFAKGRSGNPKGRPKGTDKALAVTARPRLLDEIVITEAGREVALTDRDGKVVPATMTEVAVKALALKAGKGSNPAIRTFTQLLARAEGRDPARQITQMPLIEAGLQLKAVAFVLETMAGVSIPDPLPCSDEVDIDLVSGDVTLRRPMGRQDQAFWDACWMMRREFASEQATLVRHRADPVFCGFRIALEERRSVIDQAMHMIDRLLVAKWRLAPAELAAPPRHVRPGVTWGFLCQDLSPSARRLFDSHQAVLLGQQLLRRSYEVAVGYVAAPDAPTPAALRVRLMAHPGLPDHVRAARQQG